MVCCLLRVLVFADCYVGVCIWLIICVVLSFVVLCVGCCVVAFVVGLFLVFVWFCGCGMTIVCCFCGFCYLDLLQWWFG